MQHQLQDAAYVTGIAGVLGTLAVLIYKLGVWRQRMEDARRDLASAMARFHGEASRWFRQVDQRLDAIDHVLTMAGEHRERWARWQGRVERRLQHLESPRNAEPLQ